MGVDRCHQETELLIEPADVTRIQPKQPRLGSVRFSHPLGDEGGRRRLCGKSTSLRSHHRRGDKARASPPAATESPPGQVSLPLCAMMSSGAALTILALVQISVLRFSCTFLIFLPPSSVPGGRGWGKRTTGSSSIGFVFSVMNFTLKNKRASS